MVRAGMNSGSATGQGIAATDAASTAPSVAYANGEVFVAWSQSGSRLTTPGHEVYVARYSAGVWNDAGSGSRTGGGVSNSQGHATLPKLTSNAGQLQLFWVNDDRARRADDVVSIYTKRWVTDGFVELFSGDASGNGIGTAQHLPTAFPPVWLAMDALASPGMP